MPDEESSVSFQLVPSQLYNKQAGSLCYFVGGGIRFVALARFFLWLLLPFAPMSSSLSAAEWNLYLGTYPTDAQGGIDHAVFNDQTGQLNQVGIAAISPRPGFLASHGEFLYAVNEVDKFQSENAGSLSAFRIGPQGELTPLNVVSSAGLGPCHLSVSASGKFLFAANYTGGSIVAYRLQADGQIGEQIAVFQHQGHGPDVKRQDAPHAHQIILSPDDRHVLAADLGTDQVLVYRLDQEAGTLARNDPPFISIQPGSGPRHMIFDAAGKFLYVLNELSGSITVLHWSPEKASASEVQTISTLPPDFSGDNRAGEITIHPNGRFLYATNRGQNSIATYSVAPETGKLTLLGFVPTADGNARHFTFDPSGKWLLVGNQDARSVSIFAVDPDQGTLMRSGEPMSVPGRPVCLLFGEKL